MAYSNKSATQRRKINPWIVLPEQDAVIAITSGVRDMQAVLSLVWDKLMPAMNTSALAANEPARQKLEKTNEFSLGRRDEMMTEVVGQLPRHYLDSRPIGR